MGRESCVAGILFKTIDLRSFEQSVLDAGVAQRKWVLCCLIVY
jgi:hypothetical protein